MFQKCVERDLESFFQFYPKVMRRSSKYSINSPTLKRLFNKLLGSFFRLQITFYTFSEHIISMFYVPQTQRNSSVTIRVTLDAPITFYRRGKIFLQFSPKVTWRIFRTLVNCPPVEKYCPQSNQNIFTKKSPINFIQSASEPPNVQLSNAFSTIFIRHLKKILSQFLSQGYV